jgi:hypothetical protein
VNLTYATIAEADVDPAQQLRLLAALGAWDRALRRDEVRRQAHRQQDRQIHTAGRRLEDRALGRPASPSGRAAYLTGPS